MSTIAPVITIFVRHGKDAKGNLCKYAGDEFEKRCHCRKHLRWSQNGKQYRQKAGTRSWAEAEEVKRELERQLSGREPETATEASPKLIAEALELFLTDKRLQGLKGDAIEKYERELNRLRVYCEGRSVYTVQGITRELLTEYAATWPDLYPSAFTRSNVRTHCRAFLRYCYEAQWLARVPALPKMQAATSLTLPLTAREYKRLLAATKTLPNPEARVRCHALFQLMRWSGLAIMDALALSRAELIHDKSKGIYRVVTSRQKTGTHVSVPIPTPVAEELIAVPNLSPKYFFWTGNGQKDSLTCRWSKRYIAPVFKKAGLYDGSGNMTTHRLRDTFAVDLLEKGVPLEEVSKLLGHESIRTTERSYAKWVKGRQDRLDSLVTGTWTAATKKRNRKRTEAK